jgi:hypothetical protein
MTDTKLPELPKSSCYFIEPGVVTFENGSTQNCPAKVDCYTAKQMRDYAIEAQALAVNVPSAWQPIETAPKDNKRPLYFARFDPMGKLAELDFDGIWESESESWEQPQIYYFWASANGIEEPTHWAFQDEPIPPSPETGVRFTHLNPAPDASVPHIPTPSRTFSISCKDRFAPETTGIVADSRGEFIREMNYVAWMKGIGGCEPPDEWQRIYRLGHTVALAEDQRNIPERIRGAGHELQGVIADIEAGLEFDAICFATIKRVDKELGEIYASIKELT